MRGAGKPQRIGARAASRWLLGTMAGAVLAVAACGEGGSGTVVDDTPEPGFMTVSHADLQFPSGGHSAAITVDVAATDGSQIGNPSVTWTSSDPSVATVSAVGAREATVAAVGGGVATISVQAGTVVQTVEVRVAAAGLLYVLVGPTDHNVVVVDIATNEVVERIKYHVRQHEHGFCSSGSGIAAGPQSRFVYTISGYAVCVIDVVLGQDVAVQGGYSIRGWDISPAPDGTGFWAAAEESALKLEGESLQLRGAYYVGPPSRGRLFRSIDVTPDGRTALMTGSSHLDLNGDTLYFIDTETSAVRSTGEVGPGAFHVQAHPDGESAYVVNYLQSRVYVVDIDSGAVTNTIFVGRGVRAIAFTPDGATAVTANRDDDSVSILDVLSGTEVARIPVVEGPVHVAVSPDGSKVFAGSLLSSDVSVIDMATLSVVATIPMGADPRGFAVVR